MSVYEILSLVFRVIEALLLLAIIFLTYKKRPLPEKE